MLESITEFLRHRTLATGSANQDDVAAALALLRDRGTAKKRAVADNPLDLRKIRVGEANLRGLVLTEADLNGSELTGARPSAANLTSADLRGAITTGTHFADAILDDADLRGNDLTGSDLPGSRGLTEEQLAAAVITPAA
ncbi:pentapeptide repeat-containing protein [Amycolatopsis sp. NPDC051071]|uniref:pentapeptide repeat-containing protein n=1 Tax=Amycolatopsis sp. NPDC051071 TaxID=3154637 RepID=UPI0034154486